MHKLTRTVALVTALAALLCTLLCSCENNKDENNISETETVLTIGEHNISYGLYRYFFLNYKSEYTKEELAEDASAVYAEIEEDVFSSLCGLYAVLDMCAQYGISVNDKDIQANVETTVSSIKEQYINEENDKNGEKGYAEDLANNFMTDTVLRYLVAVDLCESALYTEMIGEGGAIASDEETVNAALYGDEFIRVVQVYVNAENGEDYDINKKTAQTVYDKAKSGVDFDTLIANYSNDYSMTRDGYYINHGYMSEEFEAVAYALDVGEISEILELEDGFHIIKRLEKEEEYINDNYEELKDQYLTCKFYGIIDERQAELSVKKTDKYAEIDPALVSLD